MNACRQGFGPGKQDWGYVTVRPQAHIFWWLYYTTANVKSITKRPLLVWIPGGPGASGMGLNFDGLGPLDLDLNPNNNTWVKDYNLVFVEVPVGTGFSYFESEKVLSTNNVQIGYDLMKFLQEFYKSLPIFKCVPLYIVGISYGAKMIVEFAIQLDKAIKSKEIEANFKGIMLGNGLISPKHAATELPRFYYHLGLVDYDDFKKLQNTARKSSKAMQSKDYLAAFITARELWKFIEDDKELYMNNVLSPVPKKSWNIQTKRLEKLMNTKVYKKLKLKSHFSKYSDIVMRALSGDIMKPVVGQVKLLLDRTDIKVAVFASQLDGKIMNTATSLWVSRLNWTRAEEYKRAGREPLVIDGIVEGYVKSVKNFDMYWIMRAGHITVNENPKAVAEILRRLTNYCSGSQ